jgi:hypothetical protein
VVFFRVTESEYHDLKEASSRNAARSLSDFVRSELLACVRSGNITDKLQRRVEALEGRLDDLQSTTASLLIQNRTPGPPSVPEGVNNANSAV